MCQSIACPNVCRELCHCLRSDQLPVWANPKWDTLPCIIRIVIFTKGENNSYLFSFVFLTKKSTSNTLLLTTSKDLSFPFKNLPLHPGSSIFLNIRHSRNLLVFIQSLYGFLSGSGIFFCSYFTCCVYRALLHSQHVHTEILCEPKSPHLRGSIY